ncbi:hypothetical protein B0T10DRAFT_117096 [Thelonectria olida]|uniref:Uncharacterized protein n=1 Tax=Thelonectria olida TaxID=1576542 RepID=A0A9P8WIN9_9HYPO|nr:hypothetical protein B0T10DRAFT_117096 [Thelonectria olida]
MWWRTRMTMILGFVWFGFALVCLVGRLRTNQVHLHPQAPSSSQAVVLRSMCKAANKKHQEAHHLQPAECRPDETPLVLDR